MTRHGVTEDAPDEAFPGQNSIRVYVRNGPMQWYDPDFDSTPFWEGVEVYGDIFNYVWRTLLAEIDITQGRCVKLVHRSIQRGQLSTQWSYPVLWAVEISPQ